MVGSMFLNTSGEFRVLGVVRVGVCCVHAVVTLFGLLCERQIFHHGW